MSSIPLPLHIVIDVSIVYETPLLMLSMLFISTMWWSACPNKCCQPPNSWEFLIPTYTPGTEFSRSPLWTGGGGNYAVVNGHNFMKNELQGSSQHRNWSEIAFRAILWHGWCSCHQYWLSYTLVPQLFDKSWNGLGDIFLAAGSPVELCRLWYKIWYISLFQQSYIGINFLWKAFERCGALWGGGAPTGSACANILGACRKKDLPRYHTIFFSGGRV